MKMQKLVNGEMLVREFPSRDFVRLKKNGWKLVKPAIKNKEQSK